jgi:hypothetical protein
MSNEQYLNYLYRKYPFLNDIFLDIGIGWYPLVEELCEKINELLNTKYPDLKFDANKSIWEDRGLYVTQIKTKWGSLRFYVSSANDEIFDLIDLYEEKSGTICERCGLDGETIDVGGWYTTVCERCKNLLYEEERM